MDQISHRELVHRIGGVAQKLSTSGFCRQDVVAIVLPDGLDLLTLCLGIMGAAICAPVNPALTEVELSELLTSLNALALVAGDLDSIPAHTAQRLGIKVLLAEALLFPKLPWSIPLVDSVCVALIIQTSATTGRGKLVPITHGNLHAMAANTVQILGLQPNDRLLSMMPLFHLQGLLSSLAQLLAGGSVLCTGGFEGGSFACWLKDLGPTWYTAGPALHTAILQAAVPPREIQQSQLRFVRSIGAPLADDLRSAVERTLAVPILEGYGLTEAGMVTSNALPMSVRKASSVGRPVGVDVRILNQLGKQVPSPSDGQIAVRGPAVVTGYYNDPAATQQAFQNGWFLTGDLGHLDDDGYLFVTGRLRDMINRGGEKIAPIEVEAALSAHPFVKEAAVFGVAHPTLGEDVAAAVVLSGDESVVEAELRRFSASRLASFKVPRRIFFVDSIPRGTTGKPNRDALRQELAAKVIDFGEPLSEVEETIARIWKQLLGMDQVSARDDFFTIGGDSFAAKLMLTAVEQEFGVSKSTWDPSDFFLSADIATVARMIEAAGCATPPSYNRPAFLGLQTEGSRLPFFCFPGADENPYYFRELAQHLGNDQPFYIVRDPGALEARGVYTVEEVAERLMRLLCNFQPDAAFILGGHCYGGILAYEVARQLIALGRSVALLILFEVPTPGYPRVFRHWKGYAWQGLSMVGKRRFIGFDEAAAHLNVLRKLFAQRLKVFKRRALADAGLKQLAKPLETSEHPNVRAGRSYQPKPLGCDVVQFLAADEAHTFEVLDDPRLGWKEFTQGKFIVRPTPGIAAGIFKEPHVATLAAQCTELLDGLNFHSSDQAFLPADAVSLNRS